MKTKLAVKATTIKKASKSKPIKKSLPIKINAAEVTTVPEKVDHNKTPGITQVCNLPTVNAGALIATIKGRKGSGSFVNQITNDTEALEIERVIEEMVASTAKIEEGDLSQLESMLFNQAQALEAMFYRFAAMTVNSEYINNTQVLGQLALKCQNQSRTTAATLAEIKNPRHATFVKQQNNASVQQVNNVEVQKVEIQKSENFEKSANELLEVKNNEWLDTGTQSTPVTVDPELVPVEVSRCKD